MKKIICLIASALIGISSLFAFGLDAQLAGGNQVIEKIGFTFGKFENFTMASGLKITELEDNFVGPYFSLDYMIPCFVNNNSLKVGLVLGSEIALGWGQYTSTTYSYGGYTTESYPVFKANFNPYLGVGVSIEKFTLMLLNNFDLRSDVFSYTVGLTVRYRFTEGVKTEVQDESRDSDYYFRGDLDVF